MFLRSRLTAKRNWRRIVFRICIPALGTVGACVYSYAQYGFTLRMLTLVLMFWAGYIYFLAGLRILGSINFQLLYPTGLSLWVSFHLWDPTEHLPFGTDMEYPHLAGMFFGLAVGFLVLLVKALEDDDGTLTGFIRILPQYAIILSAVTVAGYAAFLPICFCDVSGLH